MASGYIMHAIVVLVSELIFQFNWFIFVVLCVCLFLIDSRRFWESQYRELGLQCRCRGHNVTGLCGKRYL